MKNNRQVGTQVEQAVKEHMSKLGYKIIMTNFRCKFGEIDLIAKKDGYLVFAEVKYRSSNHYGMPQEAVDYRKQQRISNVASFFLYRYHYPMNQPIRFDVVAVSEGEIQILENAFSYCGSFQY